MKDQSIVNVMAVICPNVPCTTSAKVHLWDPQISAFHFLEQFAGVWHFASPNSYTHEMNVEHNSAWATDNEACPPQDTMLAFTKKTHKSPDCAY